MRNRYPGKCDYCGEWVNTQQGHFERTPRGSKQRWSLIHASCLQERRIFKLKERLNTDISDRLRTEIEEEIASLTSYKARIDEHDGKFEFRERK